MKPVQANADRDDTLSDGVGQYLEQQKFIQSVIERPQQLVEAKKGQPAVERPASAVNIWKEIPQKDKNKKVAKKKKKLPGRVQKPASLSPDIQIPILHKKGA